MRTVVDPDMIKEIIPGLLAARLFLTKLFPGQSCAFSGLTRTSGLCRIRHWSRNSRSRGPLFFRVGDDSKLVGAVLIQVCQVVSEPDPCAVQQKSGSFPATSIHLKLQSANEKQRLETWQDGMLT